MTQDHLQTKNKLLTEVLNKRNKDISQLETHNKNLIKQSERLEAQILKMKEEVEVQTLKAEQYEQQLTGLIKPIEVETIDGRINFLVSILENYKKQLEEMDDEGEEEELDDEDIPEEPFEDKNSVSVKLKVTEED